MTFGVELETATADLGRHLNHYSHTLRDDVGTLV